MLPAQATVNVLEWDSQQVSTDSTHSPFIFPTKTTAIYDSLSNQDAYYNTGEMGNVKVVINSFYYRIIPASFLVNWLSKTVADFTAYSTSKAIYDKKKVEFNGSLRLKDDTKSHTYFLAGLTPKRDVPTYTAPEIGSYPVRPLQYTGTEIKKSSTVTIESGFGVPQAYEYTLKNTGSIKKEYRNFGIFGTAETNRLGLRLDYTSGTKFDKCESGTTRYSYMAITLIPVVGYNQQTSSEKFSLDVEAFKWRSA